MVKRNFISTWLIAFLLFIVSFALSIVLLFNYFSIIRINEIVSQTSFVAAGIESFGEDYLVALAKTKSEEYEKSIEKAKDTSETTYTTVMESKAGIVSKYRITLVDTTGKVVYDTDAVTAELDNHLQREEIHSAIENGEATVVRYSDTLNKKMIYYAVQLKDGSVLRLSTQYDTVWTMLLGIAEPICIIVIFALTFALVFANVSSRKLAKRLAAINPAKPEKYLSDDDYKEMHHIFNELNSLQVQKMQSGVTTTTRREFTKRTNETIKNSIRAITNTASTIAYVNPNLSQPSEELIREANYLENLVEDITLQTRLDYGEKIGDAEVINLYNVAKDVTEILAQSTDKFVTFRIEGDTVARLKAPKLLIYTAVFNICDNAVKYGKADGTVTISLKSKLNEVILNVRDDGAGLDEDDKSHIFDRFYRGKTSDSKKHGTGLGLSLVKSICEALNAKLKFESEIGIGTSVTIIFPKVK